MKKLLTCAVVTLLFVACEKKTDQATTENLANTDTVTIPESNEPIQPSSAQTCYLGTSGKDSLFVTLEDNLGTFTGKMRYKNFEKDSSSGTLVGTQTGDTLKVTYTYASEGIITDRQIYYLRRNNELIEGTGEYTDGKDGSKYTSTANINYDGNKLRQVDCTNFNANFSGY